MPQNALNNLNRTIGIAQSAYNKMNSLAQSCDFFTHVIKTTSLSVKNLSKFFVLFSVVLNSPILAFSGALNMIRPFWIFQTDMELWNSSFYHFTNFSHDLMHLKHYKSYRAEPTPGKVCP